MTKEELKDIYAKAFTKCKEEIASSGGTIYKWEQRNEKKEKLVSKKSWKNMGDSITCNQRYESDKSIDSTMPKDEKEIEEAIQQLEEIHTTYIENIAIQEELEQERIERLMKIVGGI